LAHRQGQGLKGAIPGCVWSKLKYPPKTQLSNKKVLNYECYIIKDSIIKDSSLWLENEASIGFTIKCI
jgi:hypothetical protein